MYSKEDAKEEKVDEFHDQTPYKVNRTWKPETDMPKLEMLKRKKMLKYMSQETEKNEKSNLSNYFLIANIISTSVYMDITKMEYTEIKWILFLTQEMEDSRMK